MKKLLPYVLAFHAALAAAIHSCMTPFSSSEHFVQLAIACSIDS